MPAAPPSDWPLALALLDEALALGPEQRAHWLAQTAASQPGVMPLLHKLLKAHGRVEQHNVLATLPKLAVKVSGLEAGATGMQVGPFELIAPLGRGGMGSVWRARYADGRLKRDVAVKLPAATSDPMALATLRERFDRERDFLAGLEHPNIARLYDAGVSASGQPFLAMEYIDGRVITDHCDVQRLGVKARLVLFLQVLDAVAHAHQHLVLHRDLKAGNVLVDAQGQVRLLDFGVARLLPQTESAAALPELSELTERAGAAFTLGHAAPEQLTHSTLSTATDVYALGVMLYHLLTGLSPYQPVRNSRGALEDAVLLATPAAASSRAHTADALEARQTTTAGLRKALRGDIDVVLGKALKKGPAERYPTVAALAQDLRSHLARLPIAARPDGWAYRARLFVERHRVAVATAAVASLALLGSSGVAVWQARVSANNAARANQEAARSLAGQKFFAGLLANADPERNKDITALDRKVVDEALANAERDFAGAPETLALVFKQLGDLYHRLGVASRRLEVLDKRVAMLRTMPMAPVDEVVEAQLSLGEALNDSPLEADRARAVPTLLAAHHMAQARRASDGLVVRALCQIADQFLVDSKNEEADAYASLAVAHAERTLPNPHPNLAWAYEQRAVTDTRLGRLDAAREAYRKAMAVDATGQGRGKRGQVNTRTNLANTEFMAANFRVAKREALSALAFSKAQLGDTGSALTNLRVRAVMSSLQAGELDEAAQLVSELLAADIASDDPARAGPANYAAGVVLMGRGKFAQAAQAFAKAQPGMAMHPRWQRRLTAQMATLKLKTGSASEAYGLLQPLVASLRAQVGTGSEEFAIVATPAAVALARQGRWGEAQRLFDEACVQRRAVVASNHPDRVRCESYGILAAAQLTPQARVHALGQQLALLSAGRDDHMPLVASLEAAKRWAGRPHGQAEQAAGFPLLD
jgi:eukaryotic-like serine/threonine-protein kinase